MRVLMISFFLLEALWFIEGIYIVALYTHLLKFGTLNGILELGRSWYIPILMTL